MTQTHVLRRLTKRHGPDSVGPFRRRTCTARPDRTSYPRACPTDYDARSTKTSRTCWQIDGRTVVALLSEIRLVARGTSAFFPGYHWMFSAHTFSAHAAGSPPLISHGRGPRRREDAFILDGEFELQVLARVFGSPSTGRLMFLRVAIEPLFRGFGIKQPIAFDDMQSLGVRRAVPIDHGNTARS